MEIAQYIVKILQDKVDDAIVSVAKKDTQQLKFSNNKIIATTNREAQNVDIFIASKKRIVSTNVEGLSKEDADAAVKSLLSFVKKVKKKKDYRGIAEGPFKYRTIRDSFDPKIASLGDSAVDIAERNINVALEHGAKRADGILEFSVFERFLKTSNDVEVEDKGTTVYLSLRAFLNKAASGHITEFSRTLKQFDDVAKAKKAAEIAAKAAFPEGIVQGKYDVIFSPLAFANILQHVGDAASAFSVESGLSFLKGKVTKQVAAKNVTMIDDGAMPNGYHSAKCDDEGVPTQKNVIIDKGVLKTYLHNTTTAYKYKTKTTANAGLTSPEPWNLELGPGNDSESSLFQNVRKGLYITNLWYTRFSDHEAGNFSTISLLI